MPNEKTKKPTGTDKPIIMMGPGSGIEQLQHCPTVERFELTEDELLEALKDPAAVAKRLGLDTPKAIHVRNAEPTE